MKKKDETIALINKQLTFIPKLMSDLEKKDADLKRSKRETRRISEELQRLKSLADENDTFMTSLERKREKTKLTKQIASQKEELEQLKEEMRKLKEDSAKVNPAQCNVLSHDVYTLYFSKSKRLSRGRSCR